MSFMTQLIEMLGAIESDKIEVHEERCISIRNRNASCIRCAEVCTSGAISYRNNELRVDPERCIGCGTCATACPTSAIEVKTPTDDELIKDIKRAIVASNGHPVIACESTDVDLDEHTCDLSQISIVPCLGRIDESVLVGLGAYKVHDVTLLCGTCDQCSHSPGGLLMRKVVESATNMLEGFAYDLPITITSELPDQVKGATRYSSDAQGNSRRDFFKSVKKESTRVAKDAVNQKAAEVLGEDQTEVPAAFKKVNENGTLSHFIPTRRVRIYNYLKHIGDPVAEYIDTRVIGSLSIDTDKCSSCRMCAVFCPTGAIKKVDDSDKFGILHRSSACMQCRLCERICPEQAITIDSRVPIGQFMGKKALYYEMKRPTWQPNKPTSMYDKVHSAIGDDIEMCMF